jgi:RimJ/RimL family protein N-acetyltransferase
MSASLSLVPMRPEHAELWAAWRAEPTTRRYNPVAESPLESLRVRLGGWDGRLIDLGREEYRYLVQLGTEPVGTAALLAPSWRLGFSEIGYLIGEQHQGRGYGKRAVELLVDLAFAQSRLRRLQALVSVENVPSQRILDRLGFTREGRLRSHFLVEGRPVDELVFGLLREEWRRA